MRDILGQICYATHTKSGSAAFFRFQDTMQIRNRTDFATVGDWFSLIAGEIDAGRPFYYRFDLPDKGTVGHAVVCDGYRIDGYGQVEIHLNYGWSGGNTDYYLIESEVSIWPESERVCIGIAPQGWGEWSVPELEGCEATTMSWGDYNGDDLPDLFVGDSFYTPGRLFENAGGTGLVWSPLPECAVSNPYASAWADYNNDQCDDLLIAGVGGATILESVFNDITDLYELQEVAGVFAPSPGTSRTCGWGDFDRDGWVDVVLGTEAGGAMVYLGGQGPGGEFGLVATLGAGEWVASVGVADVNADGLLDISAVFASAPYLRLFVGDGHGGFAPLSHNAGLHYSGMHSWADIDGDGDVDLFAAGSGLGNSLLRNDGGGVFVDVTPSDLLFSYNTLTRSGVFADWDLDGAQDLYILNSPLLGDYSENCFFRNDGSGGFSRSIEYEAALPTQGASEAAAFADVDRDGDLDLVTDGYWDATSYSRVLINNVAEPRRGMRVVLQAADGASNAALVGAVGRVRVEDLWQTQSIAGTSTGSCQNYHDMIYFVGEIRRVDEVQVDWPSGHKTARGAMIAPSTLLIREPTWSSVDVGSPGTRELQLRPNPFNPLVVVTCDFADKCDVDVSVYDVRGRKVASLFRGHADKGRHDYTWDGKTDSGAAVASGVYMFTICDGHTIRQGRATLVR